MIQILKALLTLWPPFAAATRPGTGGPYRCAAGQAYCSGPAATPAGVAGQVA